MAKKWYNMEYYNNHPNPYNVDYDTYLRRVYRLWITRHEALSYPHLWIWWDRRGIVYYYKRVVIILWKLPLIINEE